MKILNYIEISKEVEVLSDANDTFTDEIDSILENGYDKSKPVVVDQYGEILDGNHRFEAFANSGRLNEVSFVVCDWEKFGEYASNDKFNTDDAYFYEIINQIAR